MASLLKAISNWFRGKKDEAADALADPARDADFAIEDSKKMAEKFQSDIANAMAATKRLEAQRDEFKANAKKWSKAAENAAADGNRDAARQALEKKIEAENRVKTLDADIKRNKDTEQKFRKQLDKIRSKIAKAEADKEMLKARLASGKTRQALAQASSDFGNDSPLAALDNLGKAAMEAETVADAHEELSGSSEEALLEQYGGASSDVDADLDALMEKCKKKK